MKTLGQALPRQRVRGKGKPADAKAITLGIGGFSTIVRAD
tara:strand:- start:228 stop:347 length:120 start_codon:yes stop_codon:yes gene_type:complete